MKQILLRVPVGLEAIAAEEALSLCLSNGPPAVVDGTGLIVLQCEREALARLTELQSINDAFLSLGSLTFSLDTPVVSLSSKQPCSNSSLPSEQPCNFAFKQSPSTSTPSPSVRSPSDSSSPSVQSCSAGLSQRLCDAIHRWWWTHWRRNLEQWEKYMEALAFNHHRQPIRFRGNVEKSLSVRRKWNKILPTSPSISGYIGSSILAMQRDKLIIPSVDGGDSHFASFDDEDYMDCWPFSEWVVDLKQFDVECMGFVHVDPNDSQALLVRFGFLLPQFLHRDLSMRHRIVRGRTSLHPPVAYCLARFARIQPGMLVVDPCCGTGTLLIEASVHYPHAWYIGSDVDYEVITKQARINIQAICAPIDAISCDATDPVLRSGSVDIILSDLPWGRREGSYRLVQRTYPNLIKECERLLKPGTGRAYLVTLSSKLLRRCLALTKLRLVEERMIEIGYQVSLFVLEKPLYPYDTMRCQT